MSNTSQLVRPFSHAITAIPFLGTDPTAMYFTTPKQPACGWVMRKPTFIEPSFSTKRMPDFSAMRHRSLDLFVLRHSSPLWLHFVLRPRCTSVAHRTRLWCHHFAQAKQRHYEIESLPVDPWRLCAIICALTTTLAFRAPNLPDVAHSPILSSTNRPEKRPQLLPRLDRRHGAQRVEMLLG